MSSFTLQWFKRRTFPGSGPSPMGLLQQRRPTDARFRTILNRNLSL